MSSNATPAPAATRVPRLLVMGPPGSGKRTQAVSLAQRLEVPALSTGELFRAMMAYDTPLAARLRDAVAHGGYVDDETANAAVDRRLLSESPSGFLLYGYPRTLGQVRHLDAVLTGQSARLDAVVCLEVDEDELVRRLLARGEELGRIDDQVDTVRPRLALYREQTAPLVELYEQRGLVIRIDSTGSVRQVGERIDSALQQTTVASAG